MRHANRWQMTGLGLMVACIMGAVPRTVSAEGPQRTSSGTNHVPAGKAKPSDPQVVRAPEAPNPAPGSQKSNQMPAKPQPSNKGGGSWVIVPKDSPNKGGGSWGIVPKNSDAAASGTKSPGFGQAPPSKSLPEPNSNEPERVRAPEAPNAAPGQTPNPAPGPQESKQKPAKPQPTVDDWVAAAGAIVGMASSMMGGGNAGYGAPSYDGADYGAAGNASPEADAYPPLVDADAGEVPTNPPPAALMRIAIVNPTDNEVTLHFLLDGQPQTLEAGMRIDYTVTRPVLIKFSRGAQFGVGRYRLDEHLYKFRSTDHGWELYRSPYVEAIQQ